MKYYINIVTYQSLIFSQDKISRSALIKLWSQDDNKLIWANFRDEGEKVPENSVEKRPNGKLWFHIQLPSSKYGWCIDLLRNERPIGIHYDDENKYFFLYSSSREPVGENEESMLD
ncbi:hypothetical protein OKW21_003406 [Catalinimonas alkaloidigena]|uniref:hypothetical protein n=1 Tax=Catalinimonas alkaloidigena TaxID=1075417 RepID=UPI002404BBA3|nr:hypothetical protein [Catalinimonas alkaloidigena]MDF9798143.1 hypothetical protein [Catalinimonas alkaloidigena]